MSVYILNPDGTITANISDNLKDNKVNKVKDLNTFFSKNNKTERLDTTSFDTTNIDLTLQNNQGYIIAVETLGDFKSGKNYVANTHAVFNSINTEDVLTDETVEGNTSGVIGKSNDLYPYAFGTNMDLLNPVKEQLPFYKPYNTFFDLDHNYSGRNADSERDFELFADEAEMLYGIPATLLLNEEKSKFITGVTNVFNSLLDMLLGAIIPITAMSVLQGLLQAAQSGPSDPFDLFSFLKLGKTDKYGRFIQYVKFDISQAENFASRFVVNAINALIESFVSILKTSERLMNFPSIPVKPGVKGIFKSILDNISSFCIGYILYLIPGFKLDDRIKGDANQLIGSLLSAISSLVASSKCRHHYNLLIRKIVKNNYFRRQIQFKAKTITNQNDSEYSYEDMDFYRLSSFFYRFVGERMSVGHRTYSILKATAYNKTNNLFSVQKMDELPVALQDSLNEKLPVPVPIGSSVLGNKEEPNPNDIPTAKNFNKSIYSLTSLVTKTSSANTYLTYHNELVKQNEAIYQKKEIRLPREHVQKIEEIINSDYMPFSIQDLRTNEVFKFHAFLENYGDTFNVSWEDAGMGFGRMDSIKTYKGTNRKISVDFWLVSTSNEDFDYMWWMINRLIALIYPQWSAPKSAHIQNQMKAGVLMSDGTPAGIPFSQPFTQIPTGSPLVRLRLGDLFTSNYSKKGMARIFGFDLQKINYKNDLSASLDSFKSLKLESYKDNYGTTTLEGFNVYDMDDYNDYLTGNIYFPFNELDQQDFNKIDESKTFSINLKKHETVLNDIQKLFVKYSNFYYNADDSIDLDDINNPPDDADANNDNDEMFVPNKGKSFKKLVYVPIAIIDNNEEKILMLLYSVVVKSSKTSVTSAFIKNDIPKIAKKGLYDLILGLQIDKENDPDGKLAENVKNNLNLQAFMNASGAKMLDSTNSARANIKGGTDNIVNNPVIKSFESTMGEGLAGTIQGFSIGYDQAIPWELTDGSRAPMAVKIGLQLDVIHDILPGLDDKGIMRAPTYRVGNLNNEFFGKSVYDELPNNIGYTNLLQKPVATVTPTTSANDNTGK